MSWQLWTIIHGGLAAIAIGVALHSRLWWTALLSVGGVIAGAALAVVPLWLFMERSAAATGYDAGNVGIFFCCTVPLFPLVGLLAGANIGYVIDCRKLGSDRD